MGSPTSEVPIGEVVFTVNKVVVGARLSLGVVIAIVGARVLAWWPEFEPNAGGVRGAVSRLVLCLFVAAMVHDSGPSGLDVDASESTR